MTRFLAASALIHMLALALLYRSAGPAAVGAPDGHLAISVKVASSSTSAQPAALDAASPATASEPTPALPASAANGTRAANGPAITAQPTPASEAGQTPGPEAMNAYDHWLDEVRSALAAGKTYPARARLQGREGRVEIRFRVNFDGRLMAAELLHSSGHRLLDQAAMKLAREIRVPPPPSAAAAAEVLTFTLDYRLDRQAAAASCNGCRSSG